MIDDDDSKQAVLPASPPPTLPVDPETGKIDISRSLSLTKMNTNELNIKAVEIWDKITHGGDTMDRNMMEQFVKDYLLAGATQAQHLISKTTELEGIFDFGAEMTDVLNSFKNFSLNQFTHSLDMFESDPDKVMDDLISRLDVDAEGEVKKWEFLKIAPKLLQEINKVKNAQRVILPPDSNPPTDLDDSDHIRGDTPKKPTHGHTPSEINRMAVDMGFDLPRISRIMRDASFISHAKSNSERNLASSPSAGLLSPREINALQSERTMEALATKIDSQSRALEEMRDEVKKSLEILTGLQPRGGDAPSATDENPPTQSNLSFNKAKAETWHSTHDKKKGSTIFSLKHSSSLPIISKNLDEVYITCNGVQQVWKPTDHSDFDEFIGFLAVAFPTQWMVVQPNKDPRERGIPIHNDRALSRVIEKGRTAKEATNLHVINVGEDKLRREIDDLKKKIKRLRRQVHTLKGNQIDDTATEYSVMTTTTVDTNFQARKRKKKKTSATAASTKKVTNYLAGMQRRDSSSLGSKDSFNTMDTSNNANGNGNSNKNQSRSRTASAPSAGNLDSPSVSSHGAVRIRVGGKKKTKRSSSDSHRRRTVAGPPMRKTHLPMSGGDASPKRGRPSQTSSELFSLGQIAADVPSYSGHISDNNFKV